MQEPIRILLVEDSPDIVELMGAALAHSGLPWQLEVATNGVSGLELAGRKDIDVVILDVQLPGIGGFEICRQLRLQRPELAILMLTARDSELERVMGLELGADDYITKPFLPTEVFARIRAVFRRRTSSFARTIEGGQDNLLESGSLRVELGTRHVVADGRVVPLTPLEFDLICYFLFNANRVVTRVELVEQVWQEANGSDVSVNTMVNRLRRKLSDSDIDRFVRGVRGVGYQLVPADER